MRTHQMEVVVVDVEEISQHPDNANNGDVDAIEESIEVNGFFAPILVQRSTGHILVGNHRYLAAYRLGARQVPVIYLDVDAERAKRIMLADNRTARLGHDDEALLADALRDLYATDVGLAGTGYGSEDFEKLLRDLNEPLDFDANPVVDDRLTRETAEKHQKKVMNVNLVPIKDDDGLCRVIEVTKVSLESFTSRDFQRLRHVLGLAPLDKSEVQSWEVADW
jgi:hypothetical protein